MREFKYWYRSAAVLVLSLMMAAGCSPQISPFDQYAYTHTTSLKVDALNLMANATEDYAKHVTDISAVTTEVQKMAEYEKHRPKNAITAAQWEILSDTSGHLFGGFIREWRLKGTLKPAYVPLKQQQVSEAFDKIITLESAKFKN
jgi:hypothetical protein